MREVAVPGTNQTILPLKSQNNTGFKKQEIEMPPCSAKPEAYGAPVPQGQAAVVRLFGTDCSDYDRSDQSKSPE
jgi:hypothetical protein